MSLDNIRIVLVSPIYGGNVGSVCRAMANTGLSDLAVAATRRIDMNEARMMACSATEILLGRTEFASLAEAVSDCGSVIGATARLGLYRSHSRTPRDYAHALLSAARHEKVALVFGREDNGLSNEELALCTGMLQIPSAPGYTSLNLAQAVMICCYELYVADVKFEPSREKSTPATSDLRERMFAIWRETLLHMGFMKEDKADHMMLGLRRVLSRGQLSTDDVKIMMGIARQALWASRNPGHAENPALFSKQQANITEQ
jgi:tRNA/rRNA methyltransferase